jgi:hypothetical protein
MIRRKFQKYCGFDDFGRPIQGPELQAIFNTRAELWLLGLAIYSIPARYLNGSVELCLKYHKVASCSRPFRSLSNSFVA